MSAASNHECARCGLSFEPVRKKQFYCSANCRKRAHDERRIIGILIAALKELVAKYEVE